MESKVNDMEHLRKISYLLAKYASAIRSRECLSFSKKKKRKNNRSNSLNLTQNLIPTMILENYQENSFIFPGTVQKLNYEVRSTIKLVFERLLSEYSSTKWYLENSSRCIHIKALTQFWLDCYLSDMILYKILFNSLKEKEWISFEGFYNSIMSVQHANSHMFLSPKRYNKRIQDSFLTQKLLCKEYLVFFCFVQYSCDDHLNRDSVLKVVSIVNKRDRNQLSIWVDYIFTKANKFRKEKRDFISFHDFKNSILGTGDV